MSKNKLQKKDHISYSQIQNGRCLLKYKLVNLLEEIENESIPMTLGRTVHLIVHDYIKACVENSEDSDFDLINALVDKYFNESGLPEDHYLPLRGYMIIFAERGVNYDTILDFEKEFNIDITTPDGSISKDPVLIKGFIDRANCYRIEEGSVLEIIDYKHQQKVSTEDDVENDLQLNIYKTIACNYIYTGYDYVRTGIYHTKYDFIRWSPLKKISECSDTFEGIEKFITRQWDRLINTPDDQYLPVKGEVCWEYGGCPVMLAGKCPLYSKVEVKRMKTDTVDEKVRALRLMDIESKALKDEIQMHFSTMEPITVDGKQVGYSPAVSYKYILESFRTFAINLGSSLSKLTVSKTEAEKIIKQSIKMDELTEDELLTLESFKVESATNTFKYK